MTHNFLAQNPHAVYDAAANELKTSIIYARQGQFRKGHMTFLIEGLRILRQFALQLNKGQYEIQVIDTLIKEFADLLNADETYANGPSCLADLIGNGGESENV